MTDIGTQIREKATVVAARISCEADVDALDDASLREALGEISALAQTLDRVRALCASSVARRSRPELGGAGMARKAGFRGAEELLQSIGGGSRKDATSLIQVGSMLDAVQAAEEAAAEPVVDMPAPDLTPLWQRPLSTAVREGVLSTDQAQAILSGLGTPDDAVTPEELGAALVEILAAAEQGMACGYPLTVERLFKAARVSRASIDTAIVARREKEHRDQNYLNIWRASNGRVEIRGSLDPESGTHVLNAIQGAVSPKAGGPRFVDPAEAARAQRITDDPRTPEQLRADVLVDLIRIGTEADPGTIFGSTRAAVRVIVKETDLQSRTGFGAIEGSSEPVSLETIDRHLCDSGHLGIKFNSDGTKVINVGTTQRLFPNRQRIAFAILFGGCMWPDCDRPPSWTEAHHIQHYARDGGETSIENGILLCRSDHLRLHNEGWQITHDKNGYWLTPPATIDPEQQRIQLHPRSILDAAA